MTHASSSAPLNSYGYHDFEQNEFVITRPDTPTPWINYLGEGQYGGIVSNTGGGYSFDRDPRSRRVTRFRYNGIPGDQPGRYVYLRDQESGDYWSVTGQPTPSIRLDDYECRHGAGYTKIHSAYRGIAADILYFVPPATSDETYPCEIWRLRITNTSPTARTLRTFSYAEFSYWDANVDQTNLDWAMHIFRSQVREGAIIASTLFRPTFTFFTSSLPPIGFDTDREAFIGRLRDLSDPIVVVKGIPQMTQAPRGNNIASLCHELALQPGESAEIIYLLGVSDGDESQRLETVRRFKDFFASSAGAEAAYHRLIENWKAFLNAFSVETPDAQMNAMLNFWNAVQCRVNLYWSRFISAYDTGLSRGMGTRDSAQDTLATIHNLPDHAQKVLTALWKLQFQDGHTWHQVFPLTGEGGPGLAAEFPDWPQWFSDDHLWLVIAVCAYLRETGRFEYLDQVIPYQDGSQGSVWEHMLKAIEFTLEHRGPHGLPRLGFSDWDDTMNLDHGSGLAESVWTGQQFCYALLEMSALCAHLGKDAEAQRFQALHREMARIIASVAWDGAWFARAFDDTGQPVGVGSEDKHRIALNTQTWAVIGEVGNLDQQRQAMQSAHDYLNTPLGLRLMYPPYNGADPRVRGTSTYPPGAKENGGIFCHANNWAIIAAAKLGWIDRAFQYYRQFLPLNRNDSDTYLVEPYVYCQNICSPEHPQYGMGRNSWLTGTASWAYIAATQWLLGIRPTYQGLQVHPLLPDQWRGFSARRVFRGTTYHIKVERVGAGAEIALYINGRALSGDIIPLPDEGTAEIQVQVLVGKP